MAVPQELAQWVEEMKKAGLSQDTLQNLEKDFDRKEVADSFKRTVLAVADYSRQTQELAKQREDNEAYLLQLRQWKSEKEIDLRRNTEEAMQYKTAYAQAQAQLEAIKAAQEELVRQGVLDASQLPAPTVGNKPNLPANGNGSNGNGTGSYLTKEEVAKLLEDHEAQRGNYYLNVLGVNNKILKEHFELFGTPPDMEKIFAESIRLKKSPEEVWAKEYKVAEKKQAMQEADFQKRLKEEVDKGIAARLSEEAIKGNSFRQGDAASPFQTTLAKDKDRLEKAGQGGNFTGTPLFRPSHPDVSSPAVDSAFQAWREGRFRPNNSSQ